MLTLEALNYLIALGTIGMQVLSVALLVLFILRKNPALAGVSHFVGSWGLWAALLLSLAGALLSLVYSEYFGIAPCSWCWFQRIFLYPQLVLFALAAYKKDYYIADYSIVLSVLGAAVALYQHYLQMGGASVLPCPASGVGDCAKRFLFEFNYITFPLVAFSTFALLFVIMLFVRAKSQSRIQ